MPILASIAERVPGMQPGRTVRNAGVVVVALVALAVLPITVLVLAIVLPLLLVFDVRGLRERLSASWLSRLPGLADGRWYVLGGAAFFYLFVAFVVVGAAWPGLAPAATENGTGAEIDAPAANATADPNGATTVSVAGPSTSTATVTPGTTATAQAQTPTPTATSTLTASPTPTPTPTPTARTTPTASPTPTPTATATRTPAPSPTPTAASTSTPTPDRSGESRRSDSGGGGTNNDGTNGGGNNDGGSAGDGNEHAGVSLPAEVSGGEARRATVTRVIDGDTVEVRFANGEVDTVRLLGVDTPETTLSRTDPAEFEGIPETAAGKDHLYEWGGRAENYANDRLSGEQVRVVTDSESDERGYYNRLLAYIYVGDENFDRQLLAKGYARLYDSTFSLREEFTDAENEARSEDVGLWDFEGDTSAATPTPTETPTASPTPTPTPGSGEDTGNDAGGGGGDLVTPTPSNDGNLPDPYDCSDFDSQEVAQQVLDDDPSDPSGLDENDNGIACES